jgi:hypothetical protein
MAYEMFSLMSRNQMVMPIVIAVIACAGYTMAVMDMPTM